MEPLSNQDNNGHEVAAPQSGHSGIPSLPPELWNQIFGYIPVSMDDIDEEEVEYCAWSPDSIDRREFLWADCCFASMLANFRGVREANRELKNIVDSYLRGRMTLFIRVESTTNHAQDQLTDLMSKHIIPGFEHIQIRLCMILMYRPATMDFFSGPILELAEYLQCLLPGLRLMKGLASVNFVIAWSCLGRPSESTKWMKHDAKLRAGCMKVSGLKGTLEDLVDALHNGKNVPKVNWIVDCHRMRPLIECKLYDQNPDPTRDLFTSGEAYVSHKPLEDLWAEVASQSQAATRSVTDGAERGA